MSELQPATLTIFGITGDLAKRKLLPALYNLAANDRLPAQCRILGLSRRNTTVDDVIAIMREAQLSTGSTADESVLDTIRELLIIVHMDISKPEDYALLGKALDEVENTMQICMNRLYYLAIPSSLFPDVIERLGAYNLNAGCQHQGMESRLLIEKPFGSNIASAESLIDTLAVHFTEQQTYRIDHYLAKETVQNILTFRFENPLFSSSWHADQIAHIEVTAFESIGIEGRAGFYEQTGALRDLVQSHLLQLVALVTMERPKSMSAIDIHDAKETVLAQIEPIRGNEMAIRTTRAQYDTYQSEVGNSHSQTETYASITLTIDNPRWAGVPIFVRTGKALAKKISEIKVAFKDLQSPGQLNYLTIKIQPDEGIIVDLRIKKPGLDNDIEPVKLDFYYDKDLQVVNPDAYERVLVDTMRGDKTLFATSEEVLAGWKITEPILHAWSDNKVPMQIYKAGSLGPDS